MMEGMVFSASRLVFYPASWEERLGDRWPHDAVSIPDELHRAMTGVCAPEGKTLGADAKGLPCWVDRPESDAVKSVRALGCGVRVYSRNTSIDARFHPALASNLTTLLMDLKLDIPIPEAMLTLQDVKGEWHKFTVDQLRVLYPKLRIAQLQSERPVTGVLQFDDIEIP
jgi:hypothetical protein